MTLTFETETHPAPTAEARRRELIEAPAWGRIFTDHMVSARFSRDAGWHGWKIGPRRSIELHPATSVLHYGQEIFEGLKAYRHPDGSAALFRPDANARRFHRSAERMALPPLPEAAFVESVRALVRADAGWIPSAPGASLYLRPFMIATEEALGTKPSDEGIYAVIASPVADYFGGAAKAVTIWVAETFTRAAQGGTGEAKCGGNYAAGLAAQAEAQAEGCDQVVFLDAAEHRWVEELGGMNIVFVFADGSLQTPPLTGTILPGITRDSLITLARDMGLTVREEPYSIDQWREDAASGRLTEVFACGTAAVVTPIGRVKGRGYEMTVADGGVGAVTARLKAALTDIQFGKAPDPHGWVENLGALG